MAIRGWHLEPERYGPTATAAVDLVLNGAPFDASFPNKGLCVRLVDAAAGPVAGSDFCTLSPTGSTGLQHVIGPYVPVTGSDYYLQIKMVGVPDDGVQHFGGG